MPQANDPSDPRVAFGDALVRVMKIMAAVKQRAPRAHPDVDPMGYPLMFNLREEPRRVSDIAAALHLDVSTVSRQVSQLVAKGFVERLADACGRQAENQPRALRALGAFVPSPEVDAVGGEGERGFHVVVDDERDAALAAELSDRPTRLDDVVGGAVLEPELDHGRACRRSPRRLEVFGEAVEPHESSIRARRSRSSGSRLYSAS